MARKRYFTVSIPGRELTVEAWTGTHAGLGYTDFFDRCLLYRYFPQGTVKIDSIPAREAYKRIRKEPAVSFQDVQKFGNFS